MKLGVTLPTIGLADREAVMNFAERAEADGFDSVWTADHILLPHSNQSHYPYSRSGRFLIPSTMPFMDQFITLAYVAGRTQCVLLGTAVTILPLRHPLQVAKMVATLDVLSGGRTILGVGVGWLAEEFDALGIPFEHRGSLTEEHIQVLREAWTKEDPRFHGRFYQVEGVASFPQPLQKPHTPIWMAGNSRAARHRAATYCQGWLPALTDITPEELGARIQELRQMAQDNGRDPNELEMALRVNIDLSPQADPEKCYHSWALYGPSADVVNALVPYARAGVTHFIFAPVFGDRAAREATLQRLLEEVGPMLREQAGMAQP